MFLDDPMCDPEDSILLSSFNRSLHLSTPFSGKLLEKGSLHASLFISTASDVFLLISASVAMRMRILYSPITTSKRLGQLLAVSEGER